MATALLAWFVFGENFDRRIFVGMLFIVAGAAVLAWQGGADRDLTLGALAVIGACVAWGIDNNLTRKVSLSDPVQIAAIKGLIAGPVTLTLGFMLNASRPTLGSIAAAAFVGFFGYGLSLVLFVRAMRDLGAARTGAYFSIAPFIGAASATPLLGETASAQLLVAGALMAAGVWLHLTERHEHEHGHSIQEHMHRHIHDDHHHHKHSDGVGASQSHMHKHVHKEPRHRLSHTPDAHHHHSH
jgi:drug/metabolite transporter (DMT)-like permease